VNRGTGDGEEDVAEVPVTAAVFRRHGETVIGSGDQRVVEGGSYRVVERDREAVERDDHRIGGSMLALMGRIGIVAAGTVAGVLMMKISDVVVRWFKADHKKCVKVTKPKEVKEKA